jgi:hypothetical protein
MAKDKTVPTQNSQRAAKGKKGGPTTDDMAKNGRNLARAKNQGK